MADTASNSSFVNAGAGAGSDLPHQLPHKQVREEASQCKPRRAASKPREGICHLRPPRPPSARASAISAKQCAAQKARPTPLANATTSPSIRRRRAPGPENLQASPPCAKGPAQAPAPRRPGPAGSGPAGPSSWRRFCMRGRHLRGRCPMLAAPDPRADIRRTRCRAASRSTNCRPSAPFIGRSATG
jgi:hypothetical protein